MSGFVIFGHFNHNYIYFLFLCVLVWVLLKAKPEKKTCNQCFWEVTLGARLRAEQDSKGKKADVKTPLWTAGPLFHWSHLKSIQNVFQMGGRLEDISIYLLLWLRVDCRGINFLMVYVMVKQELSGFVQCWRSSRAKIKETHLGYFGDDDNTR